MSQVFAADIVKTVGLFQDVRWFGAVLDGVTDDTAAFTAAATAAGTGGTILVPLGTAILNDFAFTHNSQALVGTGLWTVLKAKAGATYVVKMQSRLNCLVHNLKVDGNALASSGLLIEGTNASGTSQLHYVDRVYFIDCLIGAYVTGTDGPVPPSSQVDKNSFENCKWETCTTGLKIDSTNAQMQRVSSSAFDSCTTAIHLAHGELFLETTGFQFNAPGQTGVLMDGVNVGWLNLKNVWMEAPPAMAVDAINGIGGWPEAGVVAEQCMFAKCDIQVGQIGGAGTIPTFYARCCRFSDCSINTTVDEAVFRDEYNSFEVGSVWNPTGAAAATSHRHQWTYQGYSHYLGTAMNSRITSGGDYVSNTTSHGVVLKSPDLHFWRVQVTNAGALTVTDLGTTMPEF